ncbi:MAG: rhodanese-like domain-containing protein [Gammaproteobacteria bacterium]|nr:rhodanese-like domain-containing protein [Gammaproteobacteria bacterium]
MLKEHSNALLIDVRSSMEFLFVGHPKGAVHIAWIDEPDWDINPDFALDIRKLVLGGVCGEEEEQHPAIILICRSGKRSWEAGHLLLNSGFDHVFNIDEGFEGELDENHQRSTVGGWRYHSLPWEQC